MGKYEPLTTFLKKQGRAEVRMTFSEIERLIRSKLPASAKEHRAWWSNNPLNSVITKAWLEAGYRTEEVDMAGRTLVFRKSQKPSGRKTPDFWPKDKPDDPLFSWMKGTITIAPGVDLTEPADPDWGDLAWGPAQEADRQ